MHKSHLASCIYHMLSCFLGGCNVANVRSSQSSGAYFILLALTHSLFSISFVLLSPGKYDWKEGRISGGAFSGKDDAFTQLLTEIYRRYALSNPLHSDVFPGVRKMEAEIVRMTLDLFQGGPDACGCVSDLVVVVMTGKEREGCVC